MLVQLGRVGQHILPYLYRLFAFIIMPRQHHQESRNLFVREARKLCQKEFKRWFRLATEVNPLMRYFKERMLPIPTLYVMGQGDHMFLAPVREQVAGYASSSLAMIQRCGHVCSVEQLDHFNRQSWRLSQRRHVSALNAWLGSSFKPLHRAHFWACSACLSCLRDAGLTLRHSLVCPSAC